MAIRHPTRVDIIVAIGTEIWPRNFAQLLLHRTATGHGNLKIFLHLSQILVQEVKCEISWLGLVEQGQRIPGVKKTAVVINKLTTYLCITLHRPVHSTLGVPWYINLEKWNRSPFYFNFCNIYVSHSSFLFFNIFGDMCNENVFLISCACIRQSPTFFVFVGSLQALSISHFLYGNKVLCVPCARFFFIWITQYITYVTLVDNTCAVSLLSHPKSSM